MIKLEHIKQTFKKETILSDLSQSFEDNVTTVIIGPSGAGKSTMLRILDLLNVPGSGKMMVDNIHVDFNKGVTESDFKLVRNRVGMVFQGFDLFPNLSVLDNVSLAPRNVLKQSKQIAEDAAHKLLTSLGIDNKANNFPETLSGGQQQRVAIARMLAMNPKYMLFDEPTSALDPELTNEITEIIQKLKDEQNTMIIVTHDMKLAQAVADKIVYMEDGKIIFYGSLVNFIEFQRKGGKTGAHKLNLFDSSCEIVCDPSSENDN